MVDAVVTVFLEKTLNILEEKGRTVSEYGKQLEILQNELQYMQTFLKDAERQKRTNDLLRKLVSDLRELVYEAEDILVDCQLADGGGDDDDGNEHRPSSNAWLSWLNPSGVSLQFKKSKRLKEINEKISGIKSRVEPYFKFRTPSNVGRDNGTDRWSSPVYDHTQVVGLEGDKKKIKNWLFRSNEDELLIMAFVGMGGLGKTTIAQEVFNDKEIEHCFERRIWVSVSQTFTEEQIMRSILRNLGDASVGDDLGTLLRKIRQYLLGKRYLIVMDDVWDKNLSWWDKIYQGLPKGQGGSVIVTTRSEDVAVKVQARGDKTHRPQLLSSDNSWLLFCKVAFAANNGTCERPELEDVGKEIVTKCKGLPLTIKAVGGLLLCKDHVYHEWKRIEEYFQDELKGNGSATDNVMSSLQLSYDELPSHLKSCFLTLSLYPEDTVIPKQQLVHGWIGEGFVMLRNGRSATESGEDCFSGLTNRCLIEVVDKTYSGTILTCKIHDMVRDLVIDIAKNDSFSNPEGLNCRHLGISGNFDEKQIKVNHKLRGVVSTTKTGEVNKLNSDLAKKITDCKYLRVLDISKSIFDAPISDILDEIASLQHLACLSLSNTHPLILFPRSMEDLQNLQILDASYCQNLKQLQPCIVMFKKLLVLDMTNCGSLECFPKGIGSLVNLEVLLGFKPARLNNGCKLGEVRNLNKLRKLGISLTRGDQIEEDELDSLINLSKLISISINCYDSYGDDLITKIDALTPPRQLYELSLQFYPGKSSPSWLSPNKLPMLRYMSICSGNLVKMHETFWGSEDNNTRWRIEGLMLSSLSDLDIDWEVLQRSMPYLRTVTANWCPELESFPIEDVGFRGGVWMKTPPRRN
ncbi:Disease resistance RPP13-like protein 4 [Cardamine amara subsp. amara]|uniref:Disease resistance RPP13-like protein 4 n=1 Tax=Cardamine amara subsp. amara TaxID=228776 RepID=A0ABD0ZZC1_CARAN